MDPERYFSQLRRICADSEPALLLCDPALRGSLAEAKLGVRVVPFTRVTSSGLADPIPPPEDAPLLVQYSSGSTREPKGCVLTAPAIKHQLSELARLLEIDPERDAGAVWLPLAHDMGLFGCLLLTYWTGHPLALSTPQRFLSDPRTWLVDCARFGATISATPNFALALAARAARAGIVADLRLRKVVIGGDRIEPDTLSQAQAVFADSGLPTTALTPAYGLAEAVLAVTMSSIHEEPLVGCFAANALADGSVVPVDHHHDGDTLRLVSVGRPIRGCVVTIGNDSSRAATGRLGDIKVNGPSLARGYLNAEGATRARFTPQGLVTGDLGFISNGHLFITGRIDDLISVGGRNIYARDVENALCSVAGIRAGSCAVVDVDIGGDRLIVAVIEPRPHHPDRAVMAEQIARSARRSAGVGIDACVFLGQGEFPRTPSGKLQRFRCRELVAEGAGVMIEVRFRNW